MSNSSLEVVEQSYLKKYCCLIHGQPVIESVLALAAQHHIDHDDIDWVRLDVFQTAYDIAAQYGIHLAQDQF